MARDCIAMPRVGLISDTHGLLRPEALAFLRGSDYIVHAGDIGDAAVLDELRRLAPLTVVRGNNDKGTWARSIAEAEVLEVGDVLIYVLHDLAGWISTLSRPAFGLWSPGIPTIRGSRSATECCM